jgi:hypothetical protein
MLWQREHNVCPVDKRALQPPFARGMHALLPVQGSYVLLPNLQASKMLGLALAGIVFAIAAMAHPGYGRHTDYERWCACKAYWVAKGELKACGQHENERKVLKLAAANFIADCGGDWTTRAARDFIKRWGTRPEPPHFSDHWRGHAHGLMSDEECKTCIEELRKGYEANGKHWFYSSLHHAAEHPEYCPTVSECRGRYSEDHDYSMFRRLQQYDPDLIHIKPNTKQPLTQKILQQRCKDSTFYLEQDAEYFERIFYIDQKVFFYAS